MLEAIRKIIDFSGQEKSRIYRAIALSFFKSLFSMFRMAAIYFVLLAFEKGELSMKPAWTALIFLGISILGLTVRRSYPYDPDHRTFDLNNLKRFWICFSSLRSRA